LDTSEEDKYQVLWLAQQVKRIVMIDNKRLKMTKRSVDDDAAKTEMFLFEVVLQFTCIRFSKNSGGGIQLGYS